MKSSNSCLEVLSSIHFCWSETPVAPELRSTFSIRIDVFPFSSFRAISRSAAVEGAEADFVV
ncbi:wsv145 [White spot syndrome virus]|uniref:Wsv145 n=4 Tax=White spot syndrome virus TaxID=342409 RepID=Q8VB51_WSSVS|nr:wsv145 [Shrimp white spot syndrome virus]AFX59521.1 wsv145 [White spot syndrome virus]AAL33149.1 wsv145 [Shrimp white spot syndrome virus]AAL89068.1 WSSV200 [Shrimp white spot syndrome virus]AWQ60329.1 wsv145 [Shrimp white spot syndrome virus]AWQ60744.1 wsv145 [Shrimp white spot syndrome virus]